MSTQPVSSSSSSSSSSSQLKPDDMQSSDYYFESYAHFGIHEEMLKDRVRTLSYKNAIQKNPELFKDKIVLDVGCGTGILSMFAVAAGAKHVYALDYSSIAEHAKEIVKENGLADKITVIRGKVEEVTLPVQTVDIIVSEWMGYCLLYENMLESVILARDKWLAKDGLMFPDKATMYICGIEDYQYRAAKIDWWDNVYGYKMTSLKKEALLEPLVDVCEPKQVMTNECVLQKFDLQTVTKEDLSYTAPFELKCTRHDICYAVVAYFDVEFTHGNHRVVLPTGPLSQETHWKQTVFYIPKPISMSDHDTIEGIFSIHSNGKNPRDMDIDIAYVHTTKPSSFVYLPAKTNENTELVNTNDIPGTCSTSLLSQIHPKSSVVSAQEINYKLR